MKSRKRRNQNWGLVIFSVALITLLWRYDFSDVNRKLPEEDNSDQFPDWTMQLSVAEHFDISGQLQAKVFSSEMQFFEADNSIDMTQPVVQLYKDGGEQWRVSADRGRIIDKTTLVLNDNVLLERPSENHTLQTQSLVALFDAQLLYSDTFVTLRAPHSVATANGMQADWQFQVLELLDNVKLNIIPR